MFRIAAAMKLWRLSLWLLPVATLIPLGDFVYGLTTIDLNAYFGEFDLVVLFILLGIPNATILVASAIGADMARTNRPVPALVIAASTSAWQLWPLAWKPEFWSSHDRGWYLLLFALPGTVAFLLGLSGLALLRNHNRKLTLGVGAILAFPVFSSAAFVVAHVLST